MLFDGLTPDGLAASCRGFCSLPGPLQTVQIAEFWGVTLALQASDAVHLGVDNLNVVRHVGRLLDCVPAPRPWELDDDGGFIGLIRKMFAFLQLSLMRRRSWFAEARFGSLTLGGGGFGLMSLMLGATFLGFPGDGARLLGICIVFFHWLLMLMIPWYSSRPPCLVCRRLTQEAYGCVRDAACFLGLRQFGTLVG